MPNNLIFMGLHLNICKRMLFSSHYKCIANATQCIQTRSLPGRSPFRSIRTLHRLNATQPEHTKVHAQENGGHCRHRRVSSACDIPKHFQLQCTTWTIDFRGMSAYWLQCKIDLSQHRHVKFHSHNRVPLVRR